MSIFVEGSLYRVTFTSRLFGEDAKNTFYVVFNQVTSAPETNWEVGLRVSDLWGSKVAPHIHSSCVLTNILFENVTDGVSLFEYPTSVAGLITTGESMPSYIAYSVRQIRTTKITRHGSKRFAGVPEYIVVGNGVVPSATWEGLTEFCSEPWQKVEGFNVVWEFNHVIVGRQLQTVNGKKTYVLVPGIQNAVQGADFRGITTQNTRKPGRGQ